MRCAICYGLAPEQPDPRLPLLRQPTCRRCRDLIAHDCGWAYWGRHRSWVRGGEHVLARQIPRRYY